MRSFPKAVAIVCSECVPEAVQKRVEFVLSPTSADVKVRSRDVVERRFVVALPEMDPDQLPTARIAIPFDEERMPGGWIVAEISLEQLWREVDEVRIGTRGFDGAPAVPGVGPYGGPSVLDEATGKWGIRVNRVEIKGIDPPPSIKDAMEKQMRADRDKRAAILTAEGQRQSAILTAEGNKQSAILNAQGQREAQILGAEADREITQQMGLYNDPKRFSERFDYVAEDRSHPFKVFAFQERGGCSYFKVGVRATVAMKGDTLPVLDAYGAHTARRLRDLPAPAARVTTPLAHTGGCGRRRPSARRSGAFPGRPRPAPCPVLRGPSCCGRCTGSSCTTHRPDRPFSRP